MADHETQANARDAAYARWLRGQVPRFSRRSLLKGAAGAAVVGLLPAAGCSESGAAAAAVGLGDDRALFERLVEVVLPVQPGSAFVPPQDLPVLDHIDTMLKRLDPGLRSDLSKGFGLFNWGAVFLGLHFRTFLSLDDEDALAYCRRWEQGNITQRGLMNAMKSMVQISYWREPATWPSVHYDGPVSAKNGTPRLGNAPLPVEDRPPEAEVPVDGAAPEGAEPTPGATSPASAPSSTPTHEASDAR